jgi:predicted nucleic acid-binding protein
MSACFDASALIKRYIDEKGSDIVRRYWDTEPTKFTTSLCFYETLTLLKVNYFYRKTINRKEYHKATLDLSSWFGGFVLPQYPEPHFLSPQVFFDAQKMVDSYNLDLSDAFQIMSVKIGFFAHMIGNSQTILVTADKKLTKAAKAEGLRVWNILKKRVPPAPTIEGLSPR